MEIKQNRIMNAALGNGAASGKDIAHRRNLGIGDGAINLSDANKTFSVIIADFTKVAEHVVEIFFAFFR